MPRHKSISDEEILDRALPLMARARAQRYQIRQLELTTGTKAAPTKGDDFRIAGQLYGRCTRGLADRGAATAPRGALVAL
jgi:hypothetical protein